MPLSENVKVVTLAVVAAAAGIAPTVHIPERSAAAQIMLVSL